MRKENEKKECLNNRGRILNKSKTEMRREDSIAIKSI